LTLRSLRNLLERPQTPLRVEHRTVAATPALAIRDTVDREDILTWWRGALGELHAMVDVEELQATGPSSGLLAGEIFQHDRGEATVYIPVAGDARPVGRVEPIVVPGAELAVVSHHGSLADIDVTYGALGSYATRHELSVDAPLRRCAKPMCAAPSTQQTRTPGRPRSAGRSSVPTPAVESANARSGRSTRPSSVHTAARG
jgi:effector-binding domain-containing protein